METDATTPASPLWTKERIQKMIDDKIEEGSNLEYKAAAALNNGEEITKDVSAFANAAGGTIIYGVKELPKPKNHLPDKIDPVDRFACSKERLDQIICTVAPKIDGVHITPVPAGTSDSQVCYVVEVPQGATAHQARDCKYYRRYNFHVQPMLDHEIRDVMGRRKHPKLEFKISVRKTGLGFRVALRAWNRGAVVPKQYGWWLLMPTIFDSQKIIQAEGHRVAVDFMIDGCHFWRVFVGATTPLFPESEAVDSLEFRLVIGGGVPEPSGDKIIATMYADDMPPIRRSFPPAVTTDWT